MKTLLEILNALKNTFFSSKEMKINLLKRKRWCNKCLHNSKNLKTKGYKTLRLDEHCTLCKCNLFLKQRSEISRCPNNYW